ncbi:MAG: hypothetical protein CMN05_02815 [Roseibacillus sp.]|nr:hypothetical protein [Roseibacillus sp.]MCP4728602.1 hypothetical protein [Roseibacillus sp.]HJM65829.1 hypothetical protein [Roseibacillus sp.]
MKNEGSWTDRLYLCGGGRRLVGHPNGIELLQEAVSHKLNHLQPLNALAKLYQKTEQLEASVFALRKVIVLSPGDLNSNFSMGLKQTGEPVETGAACGKVLPHQPRLPDHYPGKLKKGSY